MILLGDGVFRGEGNWDLQLTYKSLTIASESGDPTRTFIDCTDGGTLHTAFYFIFGYSDVVIRGLGMFNGDGGGVMGVGGAVSVFGCRPTIDTCIFAGNRARYGGAISAGTVNLHILSCTFHENEATAHRGDAALFIDSMGQSFVEMRDCILAFGRGGRSIEVWGEPVTLDCCDVFGNVGGDYIGAIEGQLGIRGNISADPLFCDPENLDLRLHSDSPCAPGGECGLMGALPIGRGPTPAEATTWGAIKALYR
ncbi:MAG: hypothetical protein FJY75_13950 [Candidatus Eisenbacteria bacterium]|uniref:Right-handed parallel beta-helix repeat-containing protein n=1 Tax=Eiseniibacteriota bacterium TaxID=2212470 RepID=A0A938BS13_UNCEI|nr:hypothetical protein [Candidatus Eisenbacteria bacterium]